MNLHQFIVAAEAAGYLATIDREVDPYLEIARLAAELDGRPVLFPHVKGSGFPVLAGVCSDRRYFGMALGAPVEQVMFRLADALAALQPHLDYVPHRAPHRMLALQRKTSPPARKSSNPKSTWKPSRF